MNIDANICIFVSGHYFERRCVFEDMALGYELCELEVVDGCDVVVDG